MSHKLYREQPFVMGDKGRNLGVSILSESDEFVLVQGVIDLFFFENNEVVLLDYKTDNVLKTDTLVERYERQLKQYEVAIYKALGVHVKETFIYSFALDKTIKL